MPERTIPLWKDCAMQITAGGTAGFIEICVMHPLDVVKTRLQVQKSGAGAYKSIGDCFSKIIKNEGFLSIYKGILPPILAETPKRATKFFTFEQYKKLFSYGASQNTALSFALAGLCSGLTEALVVNPFEVVKVRLQTDQGKFSEQNSAFQMAKKIYNEGGFGLNGLNRGLTSTLGRHGVWNMIYFGFYHNIKVYIPKSDSKFNDYMFRSLAGFTAGTLASIVNIPWDVAKSRIQGIQPNNIRKYHTCIQTMRLVYIEEGARALYKGLVPKIMRLGPGGAIMMIAYEEIYGLLKANFR